MALIAKRRDMEIIGRFHQHNRTMYKAIIAAYMINCINQKLIKKDKSRFNFGAIDIFSLALLIVGIYLLIQNNNVGWLMIILAFVKQFSGR